MSRSAGSDLDLNDDSPAVRVAVVEGASIAGDAHIHDLTVVGIQNNTYINHDGHTLPDPLPSLVLPKRAQLLGRYQSHFLTDEERARYIPIYAIDDLANPLGDQAGPDSDTPYQTEQRINALLDDHDVLLIAGDAGSGKSTFLRHYLELLVSEYEEGHPIPLYVPLVALKNPKSNLMVEALERLDFNKDQAAILKKTARFLLLLDAYDEAHLNCNLYSSNALSEWNVKVIITCRLTYLAEFGVVDSYFVPGIKGDEESFEVSRFKKIFLRPLTEGQIMDYVGRMNVVDDFAKAKKIPCLFALISNPFLLYIVIEYIDTIVGTETIVAAFSMEEAVSINDLYQLLVTCWIERGKSKILFKGGSVDPHFVKDCETLCIEIARMMQASNTSRLVYRPRSRNPLIQRLFRGDDRDDLFITASPVNKTEAPVVVVEFIHASLIDYFLAVDSGAMLTMLNLNDLEVLDESNPLGIGTSTPGGA